jgi:hypothetical protein
MENLITKVLLIENQSNNIIIQLLFIYLFFTSIPLIKYSYGVEDFNLFVGSIHNW